MRDRRDTRVICFTNNKGGSGKSTACANLGYELAASGCRVLLMDGDMQLNLTLTYFDEERALEIAQGQHTLYDAVRGRQDLQDYVIATPYEHLDLIPSSVLMSQIEYELFSMTRRELVLRECMQGLRRSGTYDYVLIDAPPTLGAWVVNVLCASDEIIIPVEASPWGLFGLANMFDFLDGLGGKTDAQVLGVLITKVDERKNYYRQTREILAGYEDIHVFETVIHVDSAVEWSQDVSRPVAVYKKSARSAAEFRKLAEEVREHGGR